MLRPTVIVVEDAADDAAVIEDDRSSFAEKLVSRRRFRHLAVHVGQRLLVRKAISGIEDFAFNCP